MFEHVVPAPADSILGLTEAFRADPNPDKVNLGVGVYRDDEGRTPVLRAVKAAEAALLADEPSKSYLPIAGDPAFAEQVEALVFGDTGVHGSGRAATAHTPGGTGALRMGADLLHAVGATGAAWLSRPTWANHKGIFAGAGFPLREYAYYDPGTRAVAFDRMLADLRGVPAGDVVVLHACCHNPSGADLAPEQWEQVAAVAAERGWMPFVDAAYLGFGDGLEADRAALRALAASGAEFLLAVSFSKNLSLYRERTGALSLVARTPEAARAAFTHLQRVVRVTYSNPPAHGGLVASRVLGDAVLRAMWNDELQAMCARIHDVRGRLADGLSAAGAGTDFSFVRAQQGIFSFSGLSDAQVEWLRAEKSIYIVGGGRINVAGVTSRNIDYVCASVAEAVRTV